MKQLPRFVGFIADALKSASGALVMANLGVTATSLVSGIIASRVLQPQLRGDLAVIMTWPMLIAIAFDVGIADAITVRSARGPETVGAALKAGFLIAATASLAGVGAGLLLLPVVLVGDQSHLLPDSALSLSYIPVALLAAVPAGALLGLQKYRSIAVIRVSGAAFFLLATLTAAATGHATPRLFAILTVVAVSPPLIIGLPMLATALRRHRAAPIHMGTGDQLNAGMRLQGARIVERLGGMEDRALANLTLPQVGIGMYQIASALAVAIQSISLAMTQWVFSKLPGAKPEERARLVMAAYGRALAGTAVASMLLLPTLPLIIPVLYGQAFGPAVVPATIVLLAAPVEAGASVLRSASRALLGVRSAVAAEVAGGVVMAVVGYAGVKAIGMSGLALAYLAGRGVSLAWMATSARAGLNVAWHELLPWSRAFTTSIRGDISALWNAKKTPSNAVVEPAAAGDRGPGRF